MKGKPFLVIKKFFDIALALMALLLTSPFWLIGIVGILITMPGLIFFAQERVGMNGKDFKIYKLGTRNSKKNGICPTMMRGKPCGEIY